MASSELERSFFAFRQLRQDMLGSITDEQALYVSILEDIIDVCTTNPGILVDDCSNISVNHESVIEVVCSLRRQDEQLSELETEIQSFEIIKAQITDPTQQAWIDDKIEALRNRDEFC